MKSPTIPILLSALLAATPALAAKPKKAPKPPAEQPVTPEGLLAQAHAAIGKGDTDLALRLAQSAIVADPARPGSYVALGDLYAEAGQPDYARAYYDAALGIDPAEPGALKAKAELDRSHPETTARNTK
ncbi:MAG TPA: tetratricopeptide repeat protein [Rhizomicrobium sp.]